MSLLACIRLLIVWAVPPWARGAPRHSATGLSLVVGAVTRLAPVREAQPDPSRGPVEIQQRLGSGNIEGKCIYPFIPGPKQIQADLSSSS
ncbi:uncharacterized protein B0T23DRAFT_56609 [Neurospora hispaniola]|uniref:Uncharacterized protein n=1 Tax=Neurospora hispaniola TaxID=588809 RepID=A0AAJ0HXQ8_9PEZI|nr:hypothetical protein B0T23DRAFT_56609 [Neurospora hispaniola]